MNCTYCSTSLPLGALFCGECGRSTSVPVVLPTTRTTEPSGTRSTAAGSVAAVGTRRPARWVEDPLTGAPTNEHGANTGNERHGTAESSVGEDGADDDSTSDRRATNLRGGAAAENEAGPDLVQSEQSVCEQCGHDIAVDDIFCGDCGSVSRSVTSAFRKAASSRDTRAVSIDSLAIPSAVSGFPHVDEKPLVESKPGAVPFASAKTELPASPDARAARALRVVNSLINDDHAEDLEATRIVSRRSGNRFVLQFSTGESVTVHGTGLVGRNPQPEPGEFFDHLVRILDAGKSVSKTHLEFGQEGDAFWIKDRFSGNGTVIKEPEVSARRAEANHRYRVVRGARIDVGEQFFIVS